jgi:putative hemolysin
MSDKPPHGLCLLIRFIPALFLLSFLALAFAQAVSRTGTISWGQILLLLFLLFLSGFLSGSETALTAIGQWKIRQIREEGEDPQGVFALLEREPTRFITTILIGNNLVNIAATALVTQISLGIAISVGASEAVALAYATGIMTLLVLIFGEITPKSLAVHNAVPIARFVIKPVYWLSVILYPVGRFFTFISSSMLRLFGLEPSNTPLITENELRLMLRSAEETGVIEAQEEQMIKGIIELEETVVREVMTPRVDVVAVPETATLEDLLAVVTEHGYSRLPVYHETIDSVRGIVYARDLLAYLKRPEALATTRASELMTPPQYVPETLDILSLLRDMRVRKNHMAIVVDEFGGTAGIVTLEDVIEEITGEIYDETDLDEEQEIQRLNDGHYRILASAHLEEVAGELRIVFGEDGEYDTLAGYLISRFGYIPAPAESCDHDGYRFVVEEADERRIISVLASPVAREIELPEGADEA